MIYTINTPVSDEFIMKIQFGTKILISGVILCGRDAVLPKLVRMIEENALDKLGIDLHGQVIFHTAVSPAGIGPTSSNKLEIENSIVPLSRSGIRIHLGKGAIHKETVNGLERYNAIYAVIPPVTALLTARSSRIRCVAFPELGMEALYSIYVDEIPAIVAAAHGRSIYD